MIAVTACSGVLGMGNTWPAATQARRGDSSEAAASGDEVYELRISASQTERALITRDCQRLADVLNERSGDKLKITVSPSDQLGSDGDVLKQAIQDANMVVNVDASHMGQYMKNLSILMMGYFADDHDEYYRVAQTDIFKGWVDSLSEDHGIRVLSFTFYDSPCHFMTNKLVNTPDDLKSMRIRTIGQEVYTEIVQAVGTTPIPMSWGEMYSGIQSKALEGCEAQNASTYPSRLHEVRKYQPKTGHLQLMQGLICDQSWFKSLPEDLQTLLVETSIETGQETAADVMTEAGKVGEAMVKAGMTIAKPDFTPFKTVVDPVYERLGYAELRDKLYKEVDKAN